MAHKFDPAHKHKLRAEWRKKVFPPVLTLKSLGLCAEDTLADIGCGIGYFAIPATEIVDPKNLIYALDTSDEMLAEVQNEVSEKHLLNVVTIKTEEYNLELPAESASFALMVTVFHEIEDKERFLSEVHRILKPAGRIAVIDWEKKPTEMGPPIDHRLSVQESTQLLTATGFKVIHYYNFTEAFYGIVAIKD